MRQQFILPSLFLSALIFLLSFTQAAQAATRWQMADDGSITLSGDNLSGYSDHIEMSGKRVSVVLRYAVQKDGSLSVNKGMVWPMLRTVPNNTHASLMRRVGWDLMDELIINNYRASHDKVERITLKATLRADSRWGDAAVTRQWFPSTEQPAVMEILTVRNLGSKDMKVTIPYYNNVSFTDPAKGVKGSYAVRCVALNPQTVTLSKGESVEFHAAIVGEETDKFQIPNFKFKNHLSSQLRNFRLAFLYTRFDFFFTFCHVLSSSSSYVSS